jgi:hypothetical protein
LTSAAAKAALGSFAVTVTSRELGSVTEESSDWSCSIDLPVCSVRLTRVNVEDEVRRSTPDAVKVAGVVFDADPPITPKLLAGSGKLIVAVAE